MASSPPIPRLDFGDHLPYAGAWRGPRFPRQANPAADREFVEQVLRKAFAIAESAVRERAKDPARAEELTLARGGVEQAIAWLHRMIDRS